MEWAWVEPLELLMSGAGLKTGDRVFVRKPFVWYHFSSYSCKFMAWVLRSKSGAHHGGHIWIHPGGIFVHEAEFFTASRPRPLATWAREREGYEVCIRPSVMKDDTLLVAEFGKWYDLAAAISLVYQRVTGKWNGRTGASATRKTFCLESMARAEGNPNCHNITMQYFEQ